MRPDTLDLAAQRVLARYHSPARRCEALGNAGGYSGSRLWRVSTDDGDWCLKAWPLPTDARRLLTIHRWLHNARTAGLPILPIVRSARHGETVHFEADRFWDMTEWLPGQADFEHQPTPTRIRAACTALAHLHRTWRLPEQSPGPCVAVQRRLDRLTQWQAALQTGWQPVFRSDSALDRLAQHCWQLLPAAVQLAHHLLEPFREQALPLHVCHGDLWHDHVLFKDDQVSGIIDFGAARIDTPAVDLARLLGSLAPLDEELYAAGLRAYLDLIALSPREQRLVQILDDTGTIVGMINWLLWLYRDGRSFDDGAAVMRRITTLTARLERLTPNARPLV